LGDVFIEARLFQQAPSKNQKFFASFFQKRSAFLLAGAVTMRLTLLKQEKSVFF
jgi:hypothetical protein